MGPPPIDDQGIYYPSKISVVPRKERKKTLENCCIKSVLYNSVYVRIIINEGEKNAKFELPFYKEVFIYFDPWLSKLSVKDIEGFLHEKVKFGILKITFSCGLFWVRTFGH